MPTPPPDLLAALADALDAHESTDHALNAFCAHAPLPLDALLARAWREAADPAVMIEILAQLTQDSTWLAALDALFRAVESHIPEPDAGILLAAFQQWSREELDTTTLRGLLVDKVESPPAVSLAFQHTREIVRVVVAWVEGEDDAPVASTLRGLVDDLAHAVVEHSPDVQPLANAAQEARNSHIMALRRWREEPDSLEREAYCRQVELLIRPTVDAYWTEYEATLAALRNQLAHALRARVPTLRYEP